ncbi:MAG: ERAP1-like C-terminal domain-containing protein [Alistipes sp.]|nr:ERAP1-like C-terminal domain-containing protein [Alistipes sp.]
MAQDDRRYDEGVSRELAEWRKATIDSVHYRLHFDLVANRGRATLSFNLAAPEEVIIDFRNTDLVVNVSAAHRLHNEHIIIAKEATRAGENSVEIIFKVDNQSLNRRDDFLYTLLVPDRARTLFPSFDQPDIKAIHQLSLTIPAEWVAVSNTSVRSVIDNGETKTILFDPTEPLSTYLFSFVAGKLYSTTYDDGNHRFTAYYRETDPKRLAQLDDIFKEVAASLEWLEEYTGIDYPFAKYDFVMLPGFQYGGMEHTGATLYNDAQMFLGENATLEERLRRTQLIAHETAHMWFGDYVTMRWFDDVWCKEVFANYFAARMAEPLYPTVNHQLNRLKTYTQAAYNEDRTLGATPISQSLDNLRNAGLIYGQTIYNKAPIVMDKIVELMGEEAFRRGMQEYLTTYAYGNASWDEIIAILDRHTDADLKTFSRLWVKRPRMPNIISFNGLVANLGNNRTQSFDCLAIYEDDTKKVVDVTIDIANPYAIEDAELIIPNIDGRGYGFFLLDRKQREWMMENMTTIDDDLMRESLVIMLNECYELSEFFKHKLSSRRWLDFLLGYIPSERNFLVGSTLGGFIAQPMLDVGTAKDEERLLYIANTHSDRSLARNLKLTLARTMRSERIIEHYYDKWLNLSDAELNESDYMTIAYELAVRLPERYDFILSTQLERITNPDRRAQFAFIIRGAHPDQAVRDELFASLMEPANRRPEPWTASLLALLNHHTRQADAVEYIYPALEELQEVQRTGDIFFPRNWVGSLLAGHSSKRALREVNRFLKDNPDYPVLLWKKIRQATWHLHRAYPTRR